MKFKRRITALIISFCVLCGAFGGGFSSAADDARRPGDINGDGSVNVVDVVALRTIIMDGQDISDEIRSVADMNGDGIINVVDVVELRLTIMRAEPEPPVPPEDGWFTSGGDKYYYRDGSYLTGIQTIGSYRYQFDESGKLMTSVGIDVSEFQPSVDWEAVKADGVEYAMIRLGYRGYGASGTMREDSSFRSHVTGALAAGLDVGVYFFSQAVNAEEAAAEAEYCLARIGDYRVSYPVCIDIEYYSGVPDARANNISKEQRTEVARAFCDTILAAGYYPVIYANPDMSNRGLDIEALAEYDFWLAHYTSSTSFAHPYQMWQYTSSGSVSGIRGNIDLNMSYKDYPAWLAENGYNKLS